MFATRLLATRSGRDRTRERRTVPQADEVLGYRVAKNSVTSNWMIPLSSSLPLLTTTPLGRTGRKPIVGHVPWSSCDGPACFFSIVGLPWAGLGEEQ